MIEFAYDNFAAQDYVHETVNHVEEYVRGQVHTQGIENFWSLLKRGLTGTYVAVEPFHLNRYIDEQVFRFNNRATKDNPLNDSDRFYMAMSQVSRKAADLQRGHRQGGRNASLRLRAGSAGNTLLLRRSFCRFLGIQLGFDFRVRHGYQPRHKPGKADEVPFGILGGSLRVIRHTRS